MADNQAGIPFSSTTESVDLQAMAKDLVWEYGVVPLHSKEELRDNNLLTKEGKDNVYIVWWAFVLGNWKAVCSTPLPDGRYYEVSFSKERSMAFVDTYRKTHNIPVIIL